MLIEVLLFQGEYSPWKSSFCPFSLFHSSSLGAQWWQSPPVQDEKQQHTASHRLGAVQEQSNGREAPGLLELEVCGPQASLRPACSCCSSIHSQIQRLSAALPSDRPSEQPQSLAANVRKSPPETESAGWILAPASGTHWPLSCCCCWRSCCCDRALWQGEWPPRTGA